MKAVPPHAIVPEAPWQRIAAPGAWHRLVEGRVEAGDLWDRRVRLDCRPNRCQRLRDVIRVDPNECFELFDDVVGQPLRLAQTAAAMDDAVSDYGRWRGSGTALDRCDDLVYSSGIGPRVGQAVRLRG